ncbi:ImmA/IrrE family metallo-endopeptidase [Massilia terrae]|uniref:ImmA/IrrE family metallo-endopeptidase n=1 Tax=Massilia terrae TaxID=1811224 RepID=A0ABT2D0R9_9BURK|nr:ImmA/IrrE family metallo-endopeptidase [Massilia terrae]MCS0659777.1 ImmA/IrrE family metallo-endopeptidase [Massilia terrae]
MTLKIDETLLSPGERLLWCYGIDTPDEIDLDAIAADRGIIIKKRRLQGADARLVATPTAGIITVSSASSEQRQRFSIGHELGHWERDKHSGRMNLCSKADLAPNNQEAKTSEAQANLFAADLILPPYLVGPRVADKDSSMNTVLEVAQEFRASREATSIRLMRLAQKPVAVMVYSRTRRRWYLYNSQWPHYIYPASQVHHDSPSMDLLYQGSPGEKTRDQKEPATRWLTGEKTWNLPDVRVQSVKLSADEILTIVRL